ncbi:tetraspanin-6-like [Eulemur rufifrons]|uniref:tetraspanin-6-like n=1 Tax=Eulemur rufifrons TaxID=859984 RepID=UPI0037445318
MLKLYAMFLTLIFLVQLVSAILGFVFINETKDNFKNNYENALKQYNSTGDYRSNAVDKIQSTLHCCGITDYRDWTDTDYYSENGFPESCCKLQDCSPQRDADKVNDEGCIEKLFGIYEAYCLSLAVTNNPYDSVTSVSAGLLLSNFKGT